MASQTATPHPCVESTSHPFLLKPLSTNLLAGMRAARWPVCRAAGRKSPPRSLRDNKQPCILDQSCNRELAETFGGRPVAPVLTKSASTPSGVLPISHPAGSLFDPGRRKVVASAADAFSMFETATLGDMEPGALGEAAVSSILGRLGVADGPAGQSY